MKTTRTALFLFASLTLLILLPGCGSKPGSEKSLNPDLAGQWHGSLKVAENMELRLVLKISKAADGALSATMDSPDQGARDLPVTSVLFNNPAFKLELEGLGAAFDGYLNRKGTEISGEWKQGPKPMPLVLRRAKPSDLEAKASELSFTPGTGAAADIRGYWKGALDVQGKPLRLVLKIGRAPNGTFDATMDSLDQGARDLPATAVSFKRPNAKLEWKLINGTFTGALSDDGKTMTGEWEQGGGKFSLMFERTEQPATVLNEAALSFVPTAGSPAIQGYWKGDLDLGQAILRLALKIGKAEDGSYSGTMDSIDQGARGIPMTAITFTSPKVQLEWKLLGARFEGTVNNEGTEISGKFNQGPAKDVPLSFARTEAPAAAR